jgi:hypothetical protein
MKKSNEFMLLFRFEPNLNHSPSKKEQIKMHQQWGAYIGGLVISEKLVSTYQLGFEGIKVKPNKSVSDGILIADNQTIGGNMIIKAIDLKEAAEIAKNCPILQMGGNVEVRSIQIM